MDVVPTDFEELLDAHIVCAQEAGGEPVVKNDEYYLGGLKMSDAEWARVRQICLDSGVTPDLVERGGARWLRLTGVG